MYEVDPLVFPRCRGVLRVVAFITGRRVIRRILDHLGASASRSSLASTALPRAEAPLTLLRNGLRRSPGAPETLATGGGTVAVPPPPSPFEPGPTIGLAVAETQPSCPSSRA